MGEVQIIVSILGGLSGGVIGILVTNKILEIQHKKMFSEFEKEVLKRIEKKWEMYYKIFPKSKENQETGMYLEQIAKRFKIDSCLAEEQKIFLEDLKLMFENEPDFFWDSENNFFLVKVIDIVEKNSNFENVFTELGNSSSQTNKSIFATFENIKNKMSLED